MKPQSIDTTPEAEAFIVEALRRMAPAEKLRRVDDLNRLLTRLAAARIRRDYGPDVGERELCLRLAALRLDRRTMIEVFGWDPEVEGY